MNNSLDHSDYDLYNLFKNGDVEEYKSVINYVMDIAKQKFRRAEKISFKFGNDIITMSVGRMLTNLILLSPYCEFSKIPKIDHFMDTHFDGPKMNDHMDITISEILEDNLDLFKELNKSLASVITNLSDIACEINKLSGITINLYNLFELIDKDKRVLDYLYWSIPKGLPFDETEKAIDNAGKELISLILSISNGPYARLLRSNSAINPDQFRQIFLTVGTKPSLEDGKVIEEPIDTSFLHGMRDARDFFICSIGARKALITTLKKVKDSGYLARKLILLVIGQNFNIDIKDCGSKHGIYTYIQNENHIKRLKWRYAIDTESGEVFPLTEEYLKYCLENEIPILLRSPVTCASKDICCTCGGDTFVLNNDIHYSEYGAINISEQLVQGFLKSKHFLTTSSRAIAWPDIMNELFVIEKSYILADRLNSISIKLDDIEETEIDDEESSTVFQVSKFTAIDDNGESHSIELPLSVDMDEDTWADGVTLDDEITITPRPETPIFRFDIENIDLSASLNDLVKKIEKETHTDINQAYADIMYSFIDSDIQSPSVGIEVILRSLVRSATNIIERPDFSTPFYPDFVILKLPQAIHHSPSVTNSIAFQKIKALLTSIDILDKKERGELDILFN